MGLSIKWNLIVLLLLTIWIQGSISTRIKRANGNSFTSSIVKNISTILFTSIILIYFLGQFYPPLHLIASSVISSKQRTTKTSDRESITTPAASIFTSLPTTPTRTSREIDFRSAAITEDTNTTTTSDHPGNFNLFQLKLIFRLLLVKRFTSYNLNQQLFSVNVLLNTFPLISSIMFLQ